MCVKKIIIASHLLISAPAIASEPGNKTYVEFGMGASISKSDLQFHNPTGAIFTLNKVSTDKQTIFLDAPKNKAQSPSAYAVMGRQLSPNFAVNASYRYLGTFSASGSAAFPVAPPLRNAANSPPEGEDLSAPGSPKTTPALASMATQSHRQVLNAKAHAFYLGAAASANLSAKVFAETTGDIGISVVSSSGTQGANLGGTGAFPRASHANVSWAIGAGLGFRLSNRVSIIARGKYIDAGKADTGTTTKAATALGMNENERLETSLKATSVSLALRFAL